MNSAKRFTSVHLSEIINGTELPVAIYMMIAQKYILVRAAGDRFDPALYQKLELKEVNYLFVLESDIEVFKSWTKNTLLMLEVIDIPEFAQEFVKSKKETIKKISDLLKNTDANETTSQAIEASKNLTTEILKLPLGSLSLKNLHSYSPDLAHHSVNVSVLACYLAIQMGYTHQGIIKNLSLGALLHDIGKTKILPHELDQDYSQTPELDPIKNHPCLGSSFLSEASDTVPPEVIMIIEQHHEHHDGSGYPHKLKSTQTYDLAKIVAIANFFENSVTWASGTLESRQKHAVTELELSEHLFEPDKFRKSLKILKQSA